MLSRRPARKHRSRLSRRRPILLHLLRRWPPTCPLFQRHASKTLLLCRTRASHRSSPRSKIHGAGAVAGSILGLASALELGPVTDLQKKLRRAERFGMPVMLSEEEKRNSRAERFGTGSPLSGRKDIGQPEEQKRKARAERFGLKIDIVVDEEAKKKARLERFAPKSMMDTSEVEKRKARAIRFSQGSPQVGSQSNYDLKATTVAHA
ncbi:hypothetical protein C4D60_Mb07t13990 [Musa balbisiana]|uniref:THO1-MOS11 C-terminal domain-containing protein n=1 Tax=Musa balbisiana TaxID=52838 RepID=A0A4S8JF55_MUSBA|nr:hypothetical protein C4D60_Mb07t13990 [Musa balbisiana]